MSEARPVFAPALKLIVRTGEGAADRITAGDPGREIGRPQRDEFLVGIHLLPTFGRERLRDRNVLEKANEADRQGERNQRQELGRGERGEREPRQSAGDFSDDAYAVARPELKSGDDGRADDHRDDRPAFRQRLRQGSREGLPARENPRQQVWKREQQQNARGADCQRWPAGLRHRPGQFPQQLVQMVGPRKRHAEQVFHLAQRDVTRRGTGKAGEHRLAQKVRENPQPRGTHRDLQGTHDERGSHGEREVARRTGLRHCADLRHDEQR